MCVKRRRYDSSVWTRMKKPKKQSNKVLLEANNPECEYPVSPDSQRTAYKLTRWRSTVRIWALKKKYPAMNGRRRFTWTLFVGVGETLAFFFLWIISPFCWRSSHGVDISSWRLSLLTSQSSYSGGPPDTVKVRGASGGGGADGGGQGGAEGAGGKQPPPKV